MDQEPGSNPGLIPHWLCDCFKVPKTLSFAFLMSKIGLNLPDRFEVIVKITDATFMMTIGIFIIFVTVTVKIMFVNVPRIVLDI